MISTIEIGNIVNYIRGTTVGNVGTGTVLFYSSFEFFVDIGIVLVLIYGKVVCSDCISRFVF